MLAAGALVASAFTFGLDSPVDIGAKWWHFVVFFTIAERAVAHVEIRQQAHTLSLSEGVLLLALMFLAPNELVIARLLGAGAAMAFRRLPLQKFVFNGALFACEAAFAGFLLHQVFPDQSDGPALWTAGALAVLIAGTIGAVAVAIVISFFDGSRPTGLLRGVVEAWLLTALTSISLAVVGVAAIRYSWTSLGYLAVLFLAAVFLLRSQATTAQRAANLESIGRFTSRLVGLTSTQQVVEMSLREASQTMRGRRAALVVDSHDGPAQIYRLESDDFVMSTDADFVSQIQDAHEPALLVATEAGDAPDGLVAPVVVGGDEAALVVWERSTEVGRFDDAGLALFKSMVAQVQVALDRAVLIDQLHYDAHHDALTQLPNRLGFADGIDLVTSKRGALFVLDLDRFKEINDTLGHPTGDRALEIIAQRLRRVVSEEAVLARLGGDEFAVFDPACGDPARATELAERLSRAIEEAISFEDLSLQVGASIGIALCPAHGDTLTLLMQHADAAMYNAKRNQLGWQFYRHEDDKNDPRRLELVSSLRRAIQARELDVWYQPKLDVATNTLIGAEALARWTHPRHGAIPPDEFIALAEGAGLMRDLTDAVLERVAADMTRWGSVGESLPVAVNLSTRNLLDETLVERVQSLLEMGGIEPRLLSFEITETAIMLDKDRVVGLLEKLRALGIRISIDDFGTGYSSLTYLRDLPVDELKIDRSFVTYVDLDAHNEVIVRSTINLGHSLGLSIVAEGIEREEEMQVLRGLGCDSAQGYLIARPLPRQKFDVWRSAHHATSADHVELSIQDDLGHHASVS